MRTLSGGSTHSDVAKLNVNNLSGIKLLEGIMISYRVRGPPAT